MEGRWGVGWEGEGRGKWPWTGKIICLHLQIKCLQSGLEYLVCYLQWGCGLAKSSFPCQSLIK